MARPPKIDDEQVLDRAMDLFWRQGWSATSIRQLEEELDLRAPSIYRRFGSKDGLARAVLDRYLDRIIDRRIERYLATPGDPIDNIWAFLDSALTAPEPDEPVLGCLLTVTALDHAAAGAELGEQLGRGLAVIEAALISECQRAAEAGRLAPGLAADVVGTQLALGFQGLMVLARSGRPSAELRSRAGALLTSLTGERFDPDRPTT